MTKPPYNIASLIPGIQYRTEFSTEGAVRRVRRRVTDLFPAGVHKINLGIRAHMYICPVTGDYIVAARADTLKMVEGGRFYACYQTFPRREAAVMYIKLCGG